jgi:hypothetical protein
MVTIKDMGSGVSADALEFRQLEREEFDLAIAWAADEGWNPGNHDADIFWETDPEGYVCACVDGEIVAVGSIVAYGREFGFMGFFIVKPGLRGQGLGARFWYWRRDRLKSRLRPGAPIGMDGVFDMQDWYARGGFVFSHRSLRMAGPARPCHPADNLAEIGTVPFDLVAAYDRRHFGFDRESFLRRWVRPEQGTALAAVRDGRLAGYGVARTCREGCKIGPLFADDADTADELFRALGDRARGGPLFLDVPECNAAGMELAARHGLTEVFGCARMYLGDAPDLPWGNIYGVTTFELG